MKTIINNDNRYNNGNNTKLFDELSYIHEDW